MYGDPFGRCQEERRNTVDVSGSGREAREGACRKSGEMTTQQIEWGGCA